MVRNALSIVFFAVIGLTGLVWSAPSAQAEDSISGTVSGNEIFPAWAKRLREIRSWKRQAENAYVRAHELGDRRTMDALVNDFAIAMADEKEAVRLLRKATTRVTVYGDAGEITNRDEIIGFLRDRNRWQMAHVHIWLKGGRYYYDDRAPRGGYDNTKGRGSSRSSSRKRSRKRSRSSTSSSRSNTSGSSRSGRSSRRSAPVMGVPSGGARGPLPRVESRAAGGGLLGQG